MENVPTNVVLQQPINLNNQADKLLLLKTNEPIIRLSTHGNDTISLATENYIYKLNSKGQCYHAPIDEINEFRYMCHMDENTVWLAGKKSLYIYDFRIGKKIEYQNVASDIIYKVQQIDPYRIIICSSYSENVVSLLDARNPYQPLQLYPQHSYFVNKIFPLADYFYSADEGGNIYKFGYNCNNIINRIKFNQGQALIDLDFNYSKGYFLILLERNIIRQTETKVFDNIDNEQTPYHCLTITNDGNKTVFANNAEVIFCDEVCDDMQEYIKTEDFDCQLRPFRQGCLFTDGCQLLYNSMDY